MNGSIGIILPWVRRVPGGLALAFCGALSAGSGCADEAPDQGAPESMRNASAGTAGKVSAVQPETKSGKQYGAPLKVSITVPDVAPGVEGTRCVQVRLGND